MSMTRNENGRPWIRRLWSWFSRYLLLVCTIVACLGILVSASSPAGTELMSLSPLLILGGSFLVAVVWCVVIVYPILAVRSRRLRVPELGLLAAPAVVVALTAILWGADLPLAVRWHFSAQAFDDAVQQVSAGTDPRTLEGDRLGLYRIHGVERRNDGIYFRTGPMASHCSMGSGFADLSGPRPTTGTSHHLGGDWYWFCYSSANVVVPDHPIGNEY